MPRFSVIMPLYNKAPYVRKAVESVVAQTCADWELVVVDDGSTDGSGDLVAQCRDPRIRLHRHQNAGVGTTRNNGVRLSSAPYLCFLDADDWWEPTYLEEMSGLIGRHPGAGAYGTAYWQVKNGHDALAPIGFEAGFTEGDINYCRVYARALCMPLWTGATCLTRAAFEEAGGFRPGVALGEDFLLWLHVALQHRVVMLNRPLSHYNQDVDPTFRGTHRLHPPEAHMLWNLGDLEPLERTNADYKQLVDNLRTYIMQFYLADDRYRREARAELAKVDWNRQPQRLRRLYRMPGWAFAARSRVLRLGSRTKQILLKHTSRH